MAGQDFRKGMTLILCPLAQDLLSEEERGDGANPTIPQSLVSGPMGYPTVNGFTLHSSPD